MVNFKQAVLLAFVFNEDFYARIDRPKGIITIKKQQKVITKQLCQSNQFIKQKAVSY